MHERSVELGCISDLEHRRASAANDGLAADHLAVDAEQLDGALRAGVPRHDQLAATDEDQPAGGERSGRRERPVPCCAHDELRVRLEADQNARWIRQLDRAARPGLRTQHDGVRDQASTEGSRCTGHAADDARRLRRRQELRDDRAAVEHHGAGMHEQPPEAITARDVDVVGRIEIEDGHAVRHGRAVLEPARRVVQRAAVGARPVVRLVDLCPQPACQRGEGEAADRRDPRHAHGCHRRRSSS